MATLEHTYFDALDALEVAVAHLPSSIDTIRRLTDAEYLAVQGRVAAIRRQVDEKASVLAGEGAYRSRPELGYSGLAAREGFKSPVELVKATTGLSTKDTTTLVAVGALVADASPTPDPVTGEVSFQWPWLTGVAAAVTAGTLSPQQAQAIRVGLGEPVGADSDGTSGRLVTVAQLATAAARLVELAIAGTGLTGAGLSPDELQRASRNARDDLDAAGVVEREKAIHADRGFRRIVRLNGSIRYIIDADIETAAFIDDLTSKLMSPRRNGPRFVDPEDIAWAEGVSADTRTPAQYLHDAITGLLEVAATSNGKASKKIVGSRKPSVRVLVTGPALSSGDGIGRIENSDLPISLDTVERIACADGTVKITFDEGGQVINLGREQRLFTPAQKLALAARDGGCIICGAEPSLTEGHHIDHWEDGGNTDIADGVLLDKFCHMLIHNNGWKITRDDDGYWLVPPPDIDPLQTPRPLNRKSDTLRELLNELEASDLARREREEQEREPGDPATGENSA